MVFSQVRCDFSFLQITFDSLTIINDDTQDNQGNDGGDQPMESGEDATNVSVEEKSKSATTRQNEKLYAEEGMLNTRMRKADKKRRKKENQTSTMEHDEYEFKVGYVKESSAMETGDEDKSHLTKKTDSSYLVG